MLVGLRDSPEVIGISLALGMDPDLVVGKLHRFWSWANTHSGNGEMPHITAEFLDRFVECSGFSKALSTEGWLRVTQYGIVIPDFDKHNSQAAKARSLATKRVAAHRKKKSNDPALLESELPPGFIKFWEKYPPLRKAAKKQCVAIWEREKLESISALIMEWLLFELRSDQWTRDLGQYVPAPIVWLRKERWADGPPSVDRRIDHFPPGVAEAAARIQAEHDKREAEVAQRTRKNHAPL